MNNEADRHSASKITKQWYPSSPDMSFCRDTIFHFSVGQECSQRHVCHLLTQANTVKFERHTDVQTDNWKDVPTSLSTYAGDTESTINNYHSS